ncbi:hypothetical protein FA95DRAFT_1607583 [Auriscalpium vulgare]|uniref:Uncharacterized protein n=1 Tax=Auriscalpium vulgare TaxID=40419 RepID=A0ACB8RPC1_9AGAM|nr:hypothetical protein FA95DRAFT_1607583 [Auriscalpium vulgare]
MLRLAKNPHDAVAPVYTDDELATIFPASPNLDMTTVRARLAAAWTSSNTRAILSWDAQVAADEAAINREAALSRQAFSALALNTLRKFHYVELDYFTETGLKRFHAVACAARANWDDTRMSRYIPRADHDLPWDDFFGAIPGLLRTMEAVGWGAPHILALRTFFDIVRSHGLRRRDPVHGEHILLQFACEPQYLWLASMGMLGSYNIARWTEEALLGFAHEYYAELRDDMLSELEQRMAELDQQRAQYVDFYSPATTDESNWSSVSAHATSSSPGISPSALFPHHLDPASAPRDASQRLPPTNVTVMTARICPGLRGAPAPHAEAHIYN